MQPIPKIFLLNWNYEHVYFFISFFSKKYFDGFLHNTNEKIVSNNIKWTDTTLLTISDQKMWRNDKVLSRFYFQSLTIMLLFLTRSSLLCTDYLTEKVTPVWLSRMQTPLLRSLLLHLLLWHPWIHFSYSSLGFWVRLLLSIGEDYRSVKIFTVDETQFLLRNEFAIINIHLIV